MRGEGSIDGVVIAVLRDWRLTKDGWIIAEGSEGELLRTQGRDITDLVRVKIAKKEERPSE